MKKYFLFLFFEIFFTAISSAQILKKLGDRVNRKIENTVNRKVDNTIDTTLDKITDPNPSEKSSQSKGETEVPHKKTTSPEIKPVLKTENN